MMAAVVVVVGLIAAPPVLRGIDQPPTKQQLASTSTQALTQALSDPSAIVRARAIRLLGARDDVDDAVFVAARRDAVAEVRTQAALAQGDRARRKGVVVEFAVGLFGDADAAVRAAAITLLVREKTPQAKQALAAHHDVDPRLQRQVAARLKRWR